MKLLKVIRLLKDKDNWSCDGINNRYVHNPTGIYFFSGVIIYNSNAKEIYSSFLAWTFVIPFYIKALKKHLQKKDSLDEIYQNWITSNETK